MSNRGRTVNTGRPETVYNAAMAEGLKGYNGSVNGVRILHGVVIATQGMPAATGRVGSPGLPSFEKPNPQREGDIEPIVERAICLGSA